MSRVFGEKIGGLEYKERKGVYGVIFSPDKNKVLTVKTSREHYFLPGGGVEQNESNQKCLQREFLEETGFYVGLDSYIGKASKYFFTLNKEPILNEVIFIQQE
ncbi:NUDIX domain-containing protein [Virgibacillus kekensis]|uniref:NUDIX domain-containing protein n=1 Tax=Virgibacillus kekensis TaxID=202261 RepID=A0ABV9DNR1_9BACI